MRYLLLLLLGLFLDLGCKNFSNEMFFDGQDTSLSMQLTVSPQIQTNTGETHRLLSLSNRLLDESVYMDIQPFTRHLYGSSNRILRTTTPHYNSYFKSLLRLMMVRMELLSQSVSQLSSMPCLNWKVSSDHYVFGMRRILI